MGGLGEAEMKMTPLEQQQLRNLIEQVRELIACIEPMRSSPVRDEVVRALNRYVAHLIESVDEQASTHH
jgi:hypothetical protein